MEAKVKACHAGLLGLACGGSQLSSFLEGEGQGLFHIDGEAFGDGGEAAGQMMLWGQADY
jgi:hypothetical protein